ncbi:MAG: M28 family peptidase [Bacteroidota bacterium]
MKISPSLSFLLFALAVFWSYESLMPSYPLDSDTAPTEFSTDRALTHVKTLSVEPRGVGFPGHERSRGYIISQLKALGLETNTQEGYVITKWMNLSKVTNTMARIKGTNSGKALTLMTHYDSHPHSSFGASDAGSGVATILEGVRAFLQNNQAPKNDIIILITDGEELGLNGASYFVNKHPWVEDIGLVLNFEARGSGGPSHMLVETNRGNANLIKGFIEANPKYPVASSLSYSIYKMLPNDTDLTVFREEADIEGFNFAFIDDHFDYHTAMDRYDRLDEKTLAHQGAYLMPLLNHFSHADLTNLKSLNDVVYINVPFFGVISYPFDWINPMLLFAILFFLFVLYRGFKKARFSLKGIAIGVVPALLVIVLTTLIGHFGWRLLLKIYPGYTDMLHGFTYNGHLYIAAFAALCAAICFWVYQKFRKTEVTDLLVFPTLLWLVICLLTGIYLKGAGFFILPVYGLLTALYVLVHQKKPNSLLLLFLGLPAIFILSPMVKMFPVGLGLKMMASSTLIVVLLFFTTLPFWGQFAQKGRIAYLSLFLAFVFGIAAHMTSGFTENRPKPSSLNYVYNLDEEEAFWTTYDNQLIPWNQQYLEESRNASEVSALENLSSKYKTALTAIQEAPLKSLNAPMIDINRDTVIGKERIVEVCFSPNRDINRLDVYTNSVMLYAAKINGIPLSEFYLRDRKKRLFTHTVTDNHYTEIEVSFPKDSILEVTFYESSNDLLSHSQFSVPERPENSIPMPFVLNDAIIQIKSIKFDN